MNPYAAPGTQPSPGIDAAANDIAEATPPTVARVAGGVVGLAGVLVVLTGAQSLAMVNVRGIMWVAPWALVVAGGAEVVLAALVFKARASAVVGAVAVSFLLLVLAGAWLVFSVAHGFFQLYAFGAPCVAIAAAVMALLALGPSQRASAARQRLKEQGMDLGI
jgi:hypothetical protein